MESEIIFLDKLEYEKVSYYTVWVHGREHSEFADFQMRMGRVAKDAKQLAEINRFIKQIGKKYGALDQYFKREGFAERLPPPTFRFIESDGETDFGLRLYCVKISEEVVILLNGDRKTTQKIDDCPNCKPHFLFANQVSDAIYLARQKEEIEIDGHYIITEDKYTLNIK